MNELQKLIDKYWSKELSPKEQIKLSELLNEDTGTLREELEKEYKSNLLSKPDPAAEQHFKDILKDLHLRIEVAGQSSVKNTVSLFQPIKWIAALLILTLGSGLYLYKKDQALKPAITHVIKAKVLRKLQQQFNTGKDKMILNFSDGSVVILQPGSSLSYYKPFVSINRSISLKGEATFKVAKDKLHPFIVTAGGFTTTALGTKFSVSTKHSDQVVIKLMEGKVVVRTGEISTITMKDIYLSPGQQLSINTHLKQPFVTSLLKDKEALIRKAVEPAKAPLVFREDTLNQVFHNLERQYKIKIRYDGITNEDMKKLFFTGTFDPSETLDGILPAICNMNDLNFKRTSDTVIISKQK